MSFTATVQDGQIVLPEGVDWPNGTRVRVEPIVPAEPQTLRELLKDFEGKAVGLPPDMAENHDHYIHGTPKK